MKQHIQEFLRRGFTACGLGPLVLAVMYLILQKQADLETLTVRTVCLGIFSLSALAFIAGGMNFIYRIEKIPLMAAILIHGIVLYASYLAAYLINGWLQWGTAPILIFSLIFIFGYMVIWAVIYTVVKKRTERLNRILRNKRNGANGSEPIQS